jgi:hypothetical protein
LTQRFGVQSQVIQLTHGATKDIALGLHGFFPGSGIDIQASQYRR